MTGLPIESAEQLAYSPEFADGTWRDDQGRNLLLAIVATIGPRPAARLWTEAERIFEARHLADSQKGLPLARTRQRTDVMPPELRLAGNRGRAR